MIDFESEEEKDYWAVTFVAVLQARHANPAITSCIHNKSCSHVEAAKREANAAVREYRKMVDAAIRCE